MIQVFKRLQSSDQKILTGLSSGIIMRMVALALSIVQVPILVAYLGQEGYGLYLVLGQFAGWVSLSDPGIANSLIGKLSQSEATGDLDLGQRTFSTAFYFLAVLLITILAVGAIITWLLPVEHLFRVENKSLISSMPVLIFFSFALPAVGIFASVIPKACLALQFHKTAAICHIIAQILGLGIVLAVSHTQLGVFGIMLAASSPPIIAAVLMAFPLIVRNPHLVPKISYVSRRVGMQMLSTGIQIMLLQISWLLVASVGEFVISSQLGTASNSIYGTSMKISAYLNTIPALLYSYLWPAYSSAWARGETSWIEKRFRISTLIVGALTLVCFGVMALGGEWMVHIWTRGLLTIDTSIWLWLIPWGLLVCIVSQINCLCNATEHVRGLLPFAAVAGLTNCILAFWWVHPFGIPGVIAAGVCAFTVQVALSLRVIRKIFISRNETIAV